jgi:hypothetical protein
MTCRTSQQRGRKSWNRVNHPHEADFNPHQQETYDNGLLWRALRDAGAMHRAVGEDKARNELDAHARQRRWTIIRRLVIRGAPGTRDPIFACERVGWQYRLNDGSPRSPLKRPARGLINPLGRVFRPTYRWLHAKFFRCSDASDPCGPPGSYRRAQMTRRLIADHLRLRAGRSKALKTLLAIPWDGDIVSGQVDPKTDSAVLGSDVFATQAGYVAATLCDPYCGPRPGGSHAYSFAIRSYSLRGTSKNWLCCLQ